jgi:hypothetical protein
MPGPLGLLGAARRLGVDRGVLGGSRPWLVVAGVAWGIKAVQYARRPEAETLVREVLEPGETIVISHGGPPPSRRALRKDRKRVRELDRQEKRDRRASRRRRAGLDR